MKDMSRYISAACFKQLSQVGTCMQTVSVTLSELFQQEPNSDLGGGLPALSTIVDHKISPPMASVSEAGKRAISTGLGKMEGPYCVSSMPPGFHSSRVRILHSRYELNKLCEPFCLLSDCSWRR